MNAVGKEIAFASGPVRVHTYGMAALLRKASKAGADAQDMKDLMHEIGMIVVRAAKPLTPVDTGALRGSIRAGRGKTKAVVRAGTRKKTPYAPVVHFGWRATARKESLFMTKALQRTQRQVIATLGDGIDQILKKNGLA